MAWRHQLRADDMQYRALVNERRCIDDARRTIDEKSEQLKAIAEISTIIAGFTISSLCEIQISEEVAEFALVLFGTITSSVIAITMVAALISTYVLVALYRYDPVKRNPTFDLFWKRVCEDDWQVAFKAFTFGMLLFALSLCAASWVLYWDHPYGSVAASIVTAICLLSIAFWYIRVYLKWAGALAKGYTKISLRSRTLDRKSSNTTLHVDNDSENAVIEDPLGMELESIGSHEEPDENTYAFPTE
eukprot:CAMPEP_0185027958 /NCGR_PEP_ID=MMETSP1103-20130426/13340_1 /TAXON_ID=36769 /ORGANISM="Paraphysomonas bandaiensis, Strain Caron Lab Isolate" /LENGTH=245 /DNA_ID=CAMNT_0027562171 /DNA_START=121 /DNA_END=858 /DNA_ORIENTATION=+